ncbi:MAG: peptidoglycan DD-metalloendopeptidase family protein [Anaerolineae bacterium]|nr:peptidoglycan DD-metalloendopeptidase family protein [Anaerolineae bacterium]
MEQSPEDNHNEVTQVAPSHLWRILRLLPLVVMLLTLVTLLILFLMGGMVKITAWYLLQFIPPLLGLISLITIVIYAIVKRRFSRLLITTLVVAFICLLPAITWVRPVAFPASLESTTPAVTVRLPADEPLKVAWGGDSVETNYHAVAPDQRWAYDLLVEPYVTGSDQLEDYGCYGVPVVAPISGLVTIAHDGEPDEIPGVVSNNYVAPTGNHVVIQMETDTYLVIAHLKQGSVAAQAGDQVAEGQVIGECGNSGNTSEPHIHIHHQRQDPAVFPLNFAEGLPLYFRDHHGPPMPVGGIQVDGDEVTLIGDTIQHNSE